MCLQEEAAGQRVAYQKQPQAVRSRHQPLAAALAALRLECACRRKQQGRELDVSSMNIGGRKPAPTTGSCASCFAWNVPAGRSSRSESEAGGRKPASHHRQLCSSRAAHLRANSSCQNGTPSASGEREHSARTVCAMQLIRSTAVQSSSQLCYQKAAYIGHSCPDTKNGQHEHQVILRLRSSMGEALLPHAACVTRAAPDSLQGILQGPKQHAQRQRDVSMLQACMHCARQLLRSIAVQ
jgi:hypothetical protein